MTHSPLVGQDAGLVTDLRFISSSSPLVVFANPRAGGGRASSVIAELREVFKFNSISAEFVFAVSQPELESQVRCAIASGVRTLLAIGGDGTFQGLVNAAFGSDALLGILPSGGGNDFASALRIPHDPVAAAKLLLRGRIVRTDLARACTADGRERLYLGGGGVGLDAEAARFSNGAFRTLPGRSRYIAAAFRALCGFKPLSLRAEFPGSNIPAIEATVLLGAVLNTPTYGAGIRLAPEAQLSDGWLDAVIVEALSVPQVLRLLPRLARTGELRTPHRRTVRAQRIRITTDPPSIFHGDGELLGPTPVEIEVVPDAIRVLVPALH